MFSNLFLLSNNMHFLSLSFFFPICSLDNRRNNQLTCFLAILLPLIYGIG